MKKKIITLLRIKAGEVAVGPSALRNQGNKGVICAARKYLKQIKPRDFLKKRERDFLRILDDYTEKLRRSLPTKAKHFGTARKALNLFLRELLYNRYLCEYYHLSILEPWLEVPLDRFAVEGIRRGYHGPLPKWGGIKHLCKSQSASYQAAARHIAKEFGISRIHLDLYWWRKLGQGLEKRGT